MIDWKLVDRAAALAAKFPPPPHGGGIPFDRITVGRVPHFEDRLVIRLYWGGKEMAYFHTMPLASGDEFELPMSGSMPIQLETQ